MFLNQLRARVNARLPGLRLTLAFLSPLALIWTAINAQTGGFEIIVRDVRLFSSRGARNPLLIAVVSGAAAWMLSRPDERRSFEEQLGRLLTWLERSRVAHTLAIALAIGVTALGIARGAFVVGGSDSYGYVSEAHLIARGALRIDQPIMREASWPDYQPFAFAPLGYRPSVDGGGIVPTYPTGYPLTLALVERLLGSSSVFSVVPVLGGVAILATYALGLALAGPSVGLCAAALMATSPSFLFQLMQPMSDVPVTAWWMLALALLTIRRRTAIVAAGLAAGLAILTRPNLVLLAVVPPFFLLHAMLRGNRVTPALLRRAATDIVFFSVGPAAASIAVALFNAHLYGSPFLSGYGASEALFNWRFITTNVYQYSSWLTMTETPFVWLAVLAPFAVGRPRDKTITGTRAMMWFWLASCAVIVGCYLPYLAFRFDEWLYLRFLLPALPPALILATVVARAGMSRIAPAFRTVVLLAVTCVIASRNFTFAVERGALGFGRGERKYDQAAQYVAEHLPENAAVLAVLHSGSVRYYSGRLTVRFDWINGPSLDGALAELRRLGRQPYFVLDVPEEAAFRERFAAHSRYGALDWPPLTSIELPLATTVQIFDPSQADAAR